MQQPHQPFMYGAAPPPPGPNRRFQPSPYSFAPRGPMPMRPSPAQLYSRASSMHSQSSPMHPPPRGVTGMNMNGGVLPSLHGTQMMQHNRMPMSPGSGVAPMPMPPPSSAPGPAFIRRSAGSGRPPTMMYPGGGPGGQYSRGMPMGVHPSPSSSFQNGMNGSPQSGMMIKDIQNGGAASGRPDMGLKSVESGGMQRITNLPTLPQGSPQQMPPPPMMHGAFGNGMVMATYGGNGAMGYVPMSGAAGGPYGARELTANAAAAMDAADARAHESGSATPSLWAINNNVQNPCDVNTPPVAYSAEENTEEEAGLTPTPPSLRHLTSYEEEEIKEYLPNVYFGGAEHCKKVHGVRGAERNDGFDDDNFHYRVVVGDHLLYRYEVVKVLGQGTFGIVVRAIDHKHHRFVAVKIIKNKPNYTKQAREEIRTLELLNGDDPEDDSNVVRLLGSSIFRKHYILVFELLPSDLYALIQANKFRPMSHEFIYELSEQLLTALVHVREHRIVHCDLKPENIMIAHGDSSASVLDDSPDFTLKLIDFGSACEESRPLFTYIQSRYYRAPEIVLGIPYTTAIDMWSFGCVLCELANGYPIFPASSEGELLERVVEYFGPIPQHLVRLGRRADRFFEDGQMRYNLGKKRAPHPPHSRSLRNFIKIGRSHEDQLFEDFVAGCLHLDARERLTPEAALEHPWMEFWRGSGSGGSSHSGSVSSSSL